MSAKSSETGKGVVLLSFSSAYVELARRIATELRDANIKVRFDEWEGGGGVPAMQSVKDGVGDAAFVLPLLTPSDVAPTWIGEEWKQIIFNEACSRGVEVLPVLGYGDLSAVPKFLQKRSYADLCNREYVLELRRLVETIRDKSDDTRIELLPARCEADIASRVSLPENPIVLEVGEGLAPLVARSGGTNPLVDQMFPFMRDGLFYELGVQYPGLHQRVGSDLPPSCARVLINGVPESQKEVHTDSVMVSESVDAVAKLGIAGVRAVNPATGWENTWIPADRAPTAEKYGLTTWDAPGFLILLLSSILRKKAADFIAIDAARSMLNQLEPVFPHLVAEAVPRTVSLFVFTDVLRRLVVEGVSIRDLRRILMALADWGRVEDDPLMLTEYVRASLQRAITYRLSRGTNTLTVLLLDPAIERSIRESMKYTSTGSYLDLEADQLRMILESIRQPIEALPDNVQVPQILTVMEIRSSVRRLVAPSLPLLPLLHVVSYQELSPETNIQPIGRISLNGFSPRAGVKVGGVPLWG